MRVGTLPSKDAPPCDPIPCENLDLPHPLRTPTKAVSIRYKQKGGVGLVGFEPTTSCSQSRRAAKLRHSPVETDTSGLSAE